MNLDGFKSNVDALIELPCLKLLTIYRCTRIGRFLRAIAKSYRDTGTSSLSAFECHSQPFPEDECLACEELIDSVESLILVKLNGTEGRLPNPGAFKRTAKSLAIIKLIATDPDLTYSAAQLGSLLDNCKNLYELTLVLGDLRSVVEGLEAVELCTLSASPSLESLLVGSKIVLVYIAKYVT